MSKLEDGSIILSHEIVDLRTLASEDAKRCLAAGMNAHLAKPLQMDQVIATIARLCACTEDSL